MRLLLLVLALVAFPRLRAGETAVRHWAFVVPERPALPAVLDQNWARTPIDRFVLARLEREGMTPSREAARTTLVRRLHLDLLGLPPSPAAVRRFVEDRAPRAYDRLVDELLASPHFGERWGRHWLDLARYADSDGYLGDNLRNHAWVYRDWVIDAINADLPFDRFTTEQLAGDLLPGATLAQRIAVGFHRNTLKNTEAGADRELNRTKEVVDRVNTTGTVWLGLTVGCAECHDHKHDPISQEEFYGLYAFFNNADEKDIAAPRPLEMAAHQAAMKSWEQEYRRLANALTAFEKRALWENCRQWLRSLPGGRTAWQPVRPNQADSGGGNTMEIQKDGSIIAGGRSGATATYTISVSNSVPTTVAAVRLELFGGYGEGMHTGRPVGRGKGGKVVVSSLAFSVETPVQRAAQQDLAAVEVTGGSMAGEALDAKSTAGWTVAEATHQYHSAVFRLERPVSVPAGGRLVFAIRQKEGVENTMRHFRLSITEEAAARPTRLPDEIAGLSSEGAAGWDDAAREQVLRHYRNLDADWVALRRPIERHLAQRPAAPTTKAQSFAERVKDRRRTHVHIRGDYSRKGSPVVAGTPATLPALAAASAAADRLDLARWLVASENPMTARVTVNRIWQRLFGVGLVATSDDFGTKGAEPSHPLLLDWLACELQASGWQRKALIRRIVLSATYRQASDVRSEWADHPGGNRLLWRQNSFRLDAESIRDAHLVASGLFDSKLGGPGIRPPLPAFVTEVGRSVKWPVSRGGDRYRRGLYIFFKRTVPYPMLISFDAPDSSVSCSRRERSNSPLQALTLLNDPVFFECAEALGGVVAKAPHGTVAEMIREMFLRCLGREPLAEEVDQLVRTHAALRVAGDGEAGVVAPAVALARIILNLDEFITRD